jgi:putative FmdB family regulatory protein
MVLLVIMPIFEYVCRDCQHAFEAIVQGGRQPTCPSCSSDALDKQLSVFAVSARADAAPRASVGACGTCGDPRGPGSCSVN